MMVMRVDMYNWDSWVYAGKEWGEVVTTRQVAPNRTEYLVDGELVGLIVDRDEFYIVDWD